ncbi:hypothetical protein AAIR98_000882 [Elusimicrobium simillimum]|uniref:hypothetical protein n=1 Tax=Elusimicrobium simillimum TaxID=3143438 RepID=UPI003C703025
MDTTRAFAMGQANRDKETMVFDWDKAAQLIKEHKAIYASAGLQGDWEYTGGYIYKDGKPTMDEYTYLASTWATPEIDIDGEIFECYKMQSQAPKWGPQTKWPKSALKILKKR